MSRKRSCCQNSTLMFAGRKDTPRKATRSGTRLRNSVRNHFTALTTQPSRSLFSHSVACCSVSNTLRIIPRFTATVSPNFAGSRRGTWITYANADESCAQRQSCGFLSRRIHCSRSAPCPWGFRARSGHREYSLSLVSDNSTEHIKEGLFGILQREFSVCKHVEKARVKIQVLPYAHSIFVTRSEEFRAELRSTARVACRHDDKMVHQPRLAHKRQSNAGMINTIQLSHFCAHPYMRLYLTDMPHGAQGLAQGWPYSRHC